MTALRRRVLRWMARAEKPAAWVLLVGGVVTFVGVLSGLIVTGEARWATLLVAAGLIVDGFAAVQEAEPDLGSSGGDRTDPPFTGGGSGGAQSSGVYVAGIGGGGGGGAGDTAGVRSWPPYGANTGGGEGGQ